jgi:hypothetical protein
MSFGQRTLPHYPHPTTYVVAFIPYPSCPIYLGRKVMAFAIITLKHPETGVIKEAPVGFSWTMFFFGIFVPAIRNDWQWFFIVLAAAICTLGLSNMLFAFFYNRVYLRNLLEKAYQLLSPGNTAWERIDAYVGYKAQRVEE